jgi:hypothetical protein
MFDLASIDWIAVLLATIALAVLGGVYFGAVVPKPYAVALGREGQPPASGALTYAGPIACSIVIVVASALLMATLDIDSMGDALAFGAIVGVGYLTPMTFTIAINPNFPRPLLYGLINAPYFVVSGLVTAAIVQLLA